MILLLKCLETKYYLTKVITEEVDIDFNDLYNKASETLSTDNVDYIYTDIMDNLAYYIYIVYGVEVEDEDDLPIIEKDFGAWMETEKGL